MSRPRSPLIVFLLATIAYGWTALPAAGWRDAAELGAAAALLGVPHPTGFPLDMLLLHAVSWMPLASLDARQNVLTALLASGALALLARAVEESLLQSRRPPTLAALGGLLAAACLAGWRTFLEASLAVEVYASALLLGGISLHPAVRGRPARLGLLGGLSSGAHLCARLIPLLLALRLLASPGPRTRRFAALTLGALLGTTLLVYLPAVSLRQPPMDWGDPQTLARFWEHVSAARIRSAFAPRLASTEAPKALFDLLAQLAELGPALPFALWGALAPWRGGTRAEREASVLGALLVSLDLLYGTLLNPMGVPDRQVGFLAAAALSALAAQGAVDLLQRLVRPLPGLGKSISAASIALAAVLWSGWRIEMQRWHDGHAAEELLGGCGALLRLPPRSVLLCEEDELCAQLWFARYAVGARPDVTVLPAQHLWEPRIRALLPVPLRPHGTPPPELRPPPAARRAMNVRVLRAWRALPAPFLLQLDTPPPELRPARPAPEPPWRLAGSEGTWSPASEALATLRTRYRARDGERLRDRLARRAWSRAFEQVGRGALDSGETPAALEAMGEATRIAPWRAAAWVNLGVVRARLGDLEGAVRASTEALRIDPRRATAWANLVGYLRAQGHTEMARQALHAARARGVRDPRLERHARALEGR